MTWDAGRGNQERAWRKSLVYVLFFKIKKNQRAEEADLCVLRRVFGCFLLNKFVLGFRFLLWTAMASVLSRKQKKKDKYTLKELKNLGRELLSSRAHINNLPLLLSFISSSSPPQYVLESLLSLQSFFTPLLPLLPLSLSKRSRTEQDPSEREEDPEVIYRTWLKSKFDDFVRSLIDLSVSRGSDDTLRVSFSNTLYTHIFKLVWDCG